MLQHDAVPATTEKRFGSALQAVTNGAPILHFTNAAREAMEPHIVKARDQRKHALESILGGLPEQQRWAKND